MPLVRITAFWCTKPL